MAPPSVDTAAPALDAAAVLLSLALLPGLLLAEVIVPPGPHSHPDAIRTLAEAHAVVLVATKLCDDLFASEEVNQLQSALGLSNADSAEAYSLIVRLSAKMNDDAHKAGVKPWCDTIYGEFGPDGTKMKRLLKRCDPHASSC